MTNLTPADWTALGTVVTAAVAVFAALFAGWQVWELRRTREEQAKPFVVVDIQPSATAHNVLNLVVENVGRTVARDVNITFEPPLKSSNEEPGFELGESLLLTEGIPMLPPGRRIEAVFDVAHQRHGTDLPMRHDVTVQLKDSRGRARGPLIYIIDLRPLYGLTFTNVYGVHHVAQSIREIEKMLRQSRTRGRLGFWVRSEDRMREQDEAEFAVTGRYPSLGGKPPPEWLLALAKNVYLRAGIRAAREGWSAAMRAAARLKQAASPSH